MLFIFGFMVMYNFLMFLIILVWYTFSYGENTKREGEGDFGFAG